MNHRSTEHWQLDPTDWPYVKAVRLRGTVNQEGGGMHVKSENQVCYTSGAYRSTTTGKGRYDLISPFALKRLAVVYEEGGKSKGDRNWESGFPFTRAIDSAERHINQYKMGLRDEDHIAQAIWNLCCVLHFEEIKPEFNDMPRYPTSEDKEEHEVNGENL